MASLEAVTRALDYCEAAGLAARGGQLSAEALDRRVAVYADALSELSDAELDGAVRLAVKRGKFFPVPAEFLECARPDVVDRAEIQDRAHRVYRLIVGEFEDGKRPCGLGPVASQAFSAAGGNAAFEWCEPGRDEQFRLKRFVDAYLLADEAADAQDQVKQITRGEAAAMLSGIKLGKSFP